MEGVHAEHSLPRVHRLLVPEQSSVRNLPVCDAVKRAVREEARPVPPHERYRELRASETGGAAAATHRRPDGRSSAELRMDWITPNVINDMHGLPPDTGATLPYTNERN